LLDLYEIKVDGFCPYFLKYGGNTVETRWKHNRNKASKLAEILDAETQSSISATSGRCISQSVFRQRRISPSVYFTAGL